jgi:hypothetical protein
VVINKRSIVDIETDFTVIKEWFYFVLFINGYLTIL